MDAALRVYATHFREAENSAELATLVHRKAYDAMGVSDPYCDMKIRADAVAENFLGRAEEFINSSDDRLVAAVRVSIVGNIMDFGSGIAIDDPDDFGEEFEELLDQGIDSDQTDELKSILSGCKNVIYIFDNCGESQFDRLLIREIKSKGIRVVGVVRGENILNDVSKEDAVRIGLDRETDRLLDTGSFAIGIDMKRIGRDLEEELSVADLVICKGMANFEALSDEKMRIPVAYLMRAKCKPVADVLCVPIGSNVVRIQSPF